MAQIIYFKDIKKQKASHKGLTKSKTPTKKIRIKSELVQKRHNADDSGVAPEKRH